MLAPRTALLAALLALCVALKTTTPLEPSSGLRPSTLGARAPQEQSADDAESIKRQLKQVPAQSPDDALKTFRVAQGFEIQLVAAEPDVTDPVDLAFDGEGRLYVVEMRGYPYARGDNESPLGRVRLLEDGDGNGRMDKSTVFVDGLDWPTGVACWEGGVFITAAPNILYCKDTDGDGVADVRRVAYTGFGRDNVQALLNNLKWGPDNWIYGAGGGNGGRVRAVEPLDPAGGVAVAEQPPIELGRRDFRFDPRTGRIESVSGGAQFGHCMDDWGRRFVCSNSNHGQHVVLPERYLRRNPDLAVSATLQTIPADGAAAPVFRISTPESWRVIRTRMRRASGVNYGAPMVAHDVFTAATGITVYRGGAFGEEFAGNVFVGDVQSNIIHRKLLRPDGPTFVASRPKGEERSEFLASTDNWFRPVNFAHGPDGALYVADFYRPVIEHPDSLPDVIKQFLDLTAGKNYGRIWRLVPPGFEPPTRRPRLSSASPDELVAHLADSNAWWRESAQRVLVERADSAAVAPLKALAASSDAPAVARMHALWTLEGLSALESRLLMPALAHSSPGLREHAVRLAETRARDDSRLLDKLLSMAEDRDPRVRFQLAFTLGALDDPRVADALASIALRDAGDRWTRIALLSSAADSAAALLERLYAHARFAATRDGADLLATLATLVGSRNRTDDVAATLNLVSDPRGAADAPRQWRLLRGLAEGLGRGGRPLSKIVEKADGPFRSSAPAVARILTDAAAAAEDIERPAGERLEAVRLLAYAPPALAVKSLPPLLSARQPQAVQLAAVASLSAVDDPAIGKRLVEHWSSASPPVRREIAEALFSRSARLPALLDALERQQIARNDLDPARVQLLIEHPNAAIKARAGKLLAGAPAPDRAKVVEQYLPALKLAGDAGRGRELYRKHCSTCHKVGDEGTAVGPDLATVTNRGPEAVLVNILDPSREANPQYLNYVLTTEQGQVITGMIAAESATSLTLRRAEGAQDVVLRQNIDTLESTGKSLMPDGLEKEINLEQMADLLEYLSTLIPPAP